MLTKKYPPITLTEANMLVLHHVQEGLRFILGDDLKRILHMTMDFARGVGACGHKALTAEFQITALCKNGRTVSTTAEIIVIEHEKVGGWTIGMGDASLETKFRFTFKTLRGVKIEIKFEFYVDTGELLRCIVWIYNTPIDMLEAFTADDSVMRSVRGLILE